MTLLARASKLLKANINHLLDSAEDPEVMVKELIRDMEAAVTELRRETVNAVARQKELERKSKEAGERAVDLEQKAALALDHGDEVLARRILGSRIEASRLHDRLTDDLERATVFAQRIKSDLRRMQQQVDTARSKKDELVRRKRAATARLKTLEAARRSTQAVGAAGGQVVDLQGHAVAFDGYADAIHEMESRAEASGELEDSENEGERRLEELVRTTEVEEELERLKKRREAKA